MRYNELVGGMGAWRVELKGGESLTGFTGYLSNPTFVSGELTRENVAKSLEVRGDYRHITELAAAKGYRLGG